MNDFLRNTVEVPVELLIQIDSALSLVAYRGLGNDDKEELIRLSHQVRAIYDKPTLKMRKINVWFFGCWEHSGHYTYDQKGREVHSIPGCPWEQLDGPLMPGIDSHGNAAIHHKGGWTAIDISDWSLDSRPGSHALFIFDADIKFAEGMLAIQSFFPQIHDRIRGVGPIVLVDNL